MHRGHLALAVAASLSAGIVAAAQAAPGAAEPDLDERVPQRIAVDSIGGGGYAIGFDTTVLNIGSAPFVLQGQRAPDQTEMTSRQVVGNQSVPAGHMRYVTTFGHEHWHAIPFQRYELHGPGGVVLRDVKQGFCLSNLHEEWCARDEPWRTQLEMGLRAGGHDTYTGFVEGQQIPIAPDTAPNGRYTLVVRIDPTTSFIERDPTNNASAVALDLRWPAGGGAPQLTVLERCLHSTSCPRPPAPPPPPPPPPPGPQPDPLTPSPPAGPPTSPPVVAGKPLDPGAAPAVLRLGVVRSRRLAAVALRREFRSARGKRAKLRVVDCRRGKRGQVACKVRWQTRSTAWSGRIRLVAVTAPSRWGYTLKLTRRLLGCTPSEERDCTKRFTRRWTVGGPYAS